MPTRKMWGALGCKIITRTPGIVLYYTFLKRLVLGEHQGVAEQWLLYLINFALLRSTWKSCSSFVKGRNFLFLASFLIFCWFSEFSLRFPRVEKYIFIIVLQWFLKIKKKKKRKGEDWLGKVFRKAFQPNEAIFDEDFTLVGEKDWKSRSL